MKKYFILVNNKICSCYATSENAAKKYAAVRFNTALIKIIYQRSLVDGENAKVVNSWFNNWAKSFEDFIARFNIVNKNIYIVKTPEGRIIVTTNYGWAQKASGFNYKNIFVINEYREWKNKFAIRNIKIECERAKNARILKDSMSVPRFRRRAA